MRASLFARADRSCLTGLSTLLRIKLSRNRPAQEVLLPTASDRLANASWKPAQLVGSAQLNISGLSALPKQTCLRWVQPRRVRTQLPQAAPSAFRKGPFAGIEDHSGQICRDRECFV